MRTHWGQVTQLVQEMHANHAEAALPHVVSDLPHGANVHQGPARLRVTNDNAMLPINIT